MAASHSGSREQHAQQGRWRPRKRFWYARRGQNMAVLAGLMAVAVLLLGLGWGIDQYHQNVVINLGADLVGAIVTIFVITPIVRRASEGREHQAVPAGQYFVVEIRMRSSQPYLE